MSRIKKVTSILLSQLEFNKNEEVYENYQRSSVENSLVAELNAKIENISVHEPDDSRYRVALSLSGSIKVQEDESDESEKSSVLAQVLLAYNLTFEANQTLFQEGSNGPTLDNAISNEIRMIIEPYYRESLQTIFNRAALEMPPLPYGIGNQKNE